MGTTFDDIAHDDAMADRHESYYDEPDAAEVAEDYYRDLFGHEVTSDELNAYAAWIAPNLEAAEALNKSAPRAVICNALSGMPNYMIDSERDDALELNGVAMLEAVVPLSGDPAWGSYGRPKGGLFHQLHRMEGNDKKGKPVNLIEVDYYPSEPDAPGKVLKTYKLTGTGICYAHIHGAVSKDDLVRYWRHVTRGVQVAATNHHYLALTDQAPPPDDSIYQYQMGGSAPWGILAYLMREDFTVPERYRDVSGNKLKMALGHVYADEASEALKLLTKEDQRLLFNDVLLHSNVDNKTVRNTFVDGLMNKNVTYEDRVTKLTEVYRNADPDSPAERIIMELICRATWAIIRRVMDYRMADDYESAMRHPLNQPPERVTNEQALEAIYKLDRVLGSFAGRVGAQESGYEGEWEITPIIGGFGEMNKVVDDERPF
mgnify:FL=1